jgi:hypothetical protein
MMWRAERAEGGVERQKGEEGRSKGKRRLEKREDGRLQLGEGG